MDFFPHPLECAIPFQQNPLEFQVELLVVTGKTHPCRGISNEQTYSTSTFSLPGVDI